MKIIDINQSIFQLISLYPELELVLFELGFKDIVKPGMLQTVGRFMTLKQGSQLKKIPLYLIIETFEKNGYHLKENNNE